MKVGTEKWPKVGYGWYLIVSIWNTIAWHFHWSCLLLLFTQKVTFDAGPQLQFLFHSDSSNSEWGYKFTVTAMGLPDITLSWMSDLQLLVARLMGRLASRTLALKSPHGENLLLNLCLVPLGISDSWSQHLRQTQPVSLSSGKPWNFTQSLQLFHNQSNYWVSSM